MTIPPLPRDTSRDPVPELRCPVDKNDSRFDPLDRWFVVEDYRINVGVTKLFGGWEPDTVQVLVDGGWHEARDMWFQDGVDFYLPSRNRGPGLDAFGKSLVGQKVKIPWRVPTVVYDESTELTRGMWDYVRGMK